MALQFSEAKTAQSTPGFNLATAAQAATIGSPTYSPPSTTTPVPVTDLKVNNILPPPAPTVSPTPFVGSVNDSLKYFQDLYTKQSTELEAARKEREDFKKILGDSYSQMDTMPDFYRQTEEQLGIPQQYKDLNQLNLQIADLTGAYDKEFARVETKGIQSGTPGIFYQGEQAAIQRQKAVEIGALSVRQAAMAGNLDLANQRAAKITELKFSPIENQINKTLKFLELNYQDMTSAEKRQADTLAMSLQLQQQQIESQKNLEKEVQSLAIEAAANGADQQTIASIQKASSLEMAINMASPYLQQTKTDIIEMNGRQVLIDTKTGNVIKDLGKAKAPNGPGTTQTERLLTQQQNVITSASRLLDAERQTSGDGFANPNTYRKAKQDYIAAGGSSANFFQSFPLEVYVSSPNRKGDLLGTSAEIKQVEQKTEQNELDDLLKRSSDGKDLGNLNLKEKTRLLELLGG